MRWARPVREPMRLHCPQGSLMTMPHRLERILQLRTKMVDICLAEVLSVAIPQLVDLMKGLRH